DLGLGLARRRGLGRSFGRGVAINSKSLESPEAQKELLENKRDVLKNRLQAIDEQLKSL
ncbi:MAG: DUF5320 domain-containing protein, partial [Lentisphaerae bacterium]|nr:DUF5320 domain-containing protein [Lentisphaerota bacterium]